MHNHAIFDNQSALYVVLSNFPRHKSFEIVSLHKFTKKKCWNDEGGARGVASLSRQDSCSSLSLGTASPPSPYSLQECSR